MALNSCILILFTSIILVVSRLTSALEEDHDVRSAPVDLFKVQRDDIAVELEGLSDGCVHLTLGQVWSVLSDPV